jgi:hypothetical protein
MVPIREDEETYQCFAEFMITSANGLSAADVSGDRTKLVPSIPAQPSNASNFPQSVQIIIDSRLYILPLSQCDSWFVSCQFI